MIIYEVRYDGGDGSDVEWFRNKAQAEKRQRELSGYSMCIGIEWVEEIVQHVIEPNKDGFVRFLNHHAGRNNG